MRSLLTTQCNRLPDQMSGLACPRTRSPAKLRKGHATISQPTSLIPARNQLVKTTCHQLREVPSQPEVRAVTNTAQTPCCQLREAPSQPEVHAETNPVQISCCLLREASSQPEVHAVTNPVHQPSPLPAVSIGRYLDSQRSVQ